MTADERGATFISAVTDRRYRARLADRSIPLHGYWHRINHTFG